MHLDTRPDGWLTQITPQLRPKTTASADAKARQTRDLRNQVENVAGKLKRAQAANDKPEVARLTARLTSLKQQLPGVEPPPAEAQRLAELTPTVLAAIVQQAYLRTLSRHPDEDELARAQRYLSESEDPVKGARDLLWTLVNTKEFIVNH